MCSLANDPGLKHVTPPYLNTFCSLLSPRIICTKKHNYTSNQYCWCNSTLLCDSGYEHKCVLEANGEANTVWGVGYKWRQWSWFQLIGWIVRGRGQRWLWWTRVATNCKRKLNCNWCALTDTTIKKDCQKKYELTWENGSLVSAVEGGIKHERRILYKRSRRKITISWE